MNVTEPPDRLFAELFEQVQSRHLFGDSKTFVDATPKSDPASILRAFRTESDKPDFDLKVFVEANFELPESHIDAPSEPRGLPVEERIDQLWDLLTRAADE